MSSPVTVQERRGTRHEAQWGSWLRIWLVTLLAGAALTVVLFSTLFVLVIDPVPPGGHFRNFPSGVFQGVVQMAGDGALMAIVLMTGCAIVLRWSWLRQHARDGGETVRSQVAIGGLAGGASLLLAGFLGLDWEPSLTRDLSGVLWMMAPELVAPLILGGAGAGYLAHRRWGPSKPGWWAIVVGLSVAGALVAATVMWFRL